jgi:hypothetical protein
MYGLKHQNSQRGACISMKAACKLDIFVHLLHSHRLSVGAGILFFAYRLINSMENVLHRYVEKCTSTTSITQGKFQTVYTN